MCSDPELDLPQNAFSNRLQPLGFNFFEMLVVDLMHKFELGVWKALFIHLLRILATTNPALLHELDQRYACHISSICNYCSLWCSYREIATFGRDTIQKFRSNVSELKKMAARDFEHLLQVGSHIVLLHHLL
jgi:hypothetical protein